VEVDHDPVRGELRFTPQARAAEVGAAAQ
jgi:hypothetical protein